MHKTIKILHLEDLPSDAELIHKVLIKSRLDFQRVLVDSREKYKEALIDFCPDIILADHSLPSFDSHEALTILHETGLKIPFILITSAMSDEFAVNIIKRGAEDYIIKDRLNRLPSSINNALEKFRLERERQLSLDELIKNEKRYRALIENITDAIELVNEHKDVFYRSPAVTRITGFACDDTVKRKMFEYVHPDDLETCCALQKQLYDNPGIPLYYQHRILHKESHYIWTEGTITNLLHDESVKAFIINYRDITERKKVEEKLNLSRLYAESIVSTIREPLIILDERMQVKSANRAFYNKFQTTQEKTEGELLFKLGNNQWDKPFVLMLLGDILADKASVVDFEVTHNFPVLGKRTMVLNASRVVQENSDERSILLAMEDITEQRKKDKELQRINLHVRRMNVELEKKVSDRTLILQEALQKLEKSELELTEALNKEKVLNELKSRFVSMASHEFRTPLTSILTSAMLIAKYKLAEEQDRRDKHALNIKHSVNDLNELLEDFLSLGKLEEGRVRKMLENIDMNQYFQHILEEMNMLLKPGQELKLVFEGYDNFITDRRLLRNVLINLLTNAIKFSEEYKTITITANNSGTELFVQIKDEGIGIPSEDIPYLFTSFYRGKNADNIKGSGLGLHIVKRYLDILDGNITLASTLNEGTAFNLQIPSLELA